MNSLERLPAQRMSAAGCTVFSEILSSRQPARALHEAFRAGRILVSDLPEMIGNIWTRDDSPTSDVGQPDWLEIFRAIGFFTYPPLGVRQPDGEIVPLGRPTSAVTLYRGSTADRLERMSWASDRAVAEELGRRHTWYGATALYQTAIAPEMILAYLERRDDWGWTIVVDPAGLTKIERLADIRRLQTPTA